MSTNCEDYSCAADCELLAEMEEERDTWVRAALIGINNSRLLEDLECFGMSYYQRVALAYALAELGENWREELEENP